MSEVLKTPAAKWREQGQTDPHGRHYDCQRATLALGDYTDDELANAVFMHGDTRPPLAEVIAGRAKMPIAYLTAAKDRIRWLSRSLEASTAREAALQQLLNAADQRIDDLVELLRECLNVVRFGEDFDLPVTTMGRIDAALKIETCGACNGCADGCRVDRESPLGLDPKIIGIERTPPTEYDEP